MSAPCDINLQAEAITEDVALAVEPLASAPGGGITAESDPVYLAEKPQLIAAIAACAKSADVAAALEAERRARQTAIDNAIIAAIDDTWEGSY